jgi:SAM-dependent methyltransferase
VTAVAHAPAARPPAAHPGCLYCGGRDLDPLYSGVRDRLGHVPGERTFRRCRTCGSAVLDPLPRTDELAAFYPPVYSFTTELGGQSRVKRFLAALEYRLFFGPQYTAQTRRVMRACGWRRGDGRRLLDVGCGRGLRLLEFRKLGFDVHGLDVQPDVVRFLREELKIPAEVADVSEIGKFHPPGSFDLVTAFFLIEHIPDVRGAFAAVFELLKPGGWVAAAVPFRDAPQAGWFGANWINATEAPRHLSLPTRAGMTAVCKAVGFERVEIVPDSVLNCAGQVASSALPGASLTHAYGKGGLLPFARRAVGAGVMAAAVPWCAVENYALGRPSLGIALARKPGG